MQKSNQMEKNKFRNQDGSLTRYAFLCGYVQKVEKNGRYKEMYMEHRAYFVRAGVIGEKYDTWECFDSMLTRARNYFNKIKL